jgi:hypothetical protein
VSESARPASGVGTWGKRVAAIGFAVLIVFGNLWLANAVMGFAVPVWVWDGFHVGWGVALVGGMVMLVAFVRAQLAPRPATPSESDAED